jgi:hypothetical protein
MLWQYLTNSFQTHAGRSCLDTLSLPGMDRLEVDLLEDWSSIEEQIQPVDAKNVERASRKEPSKLFTSTQILMTGPGVSFNSGLGLASRIFHRTVSMAPQPGQLLRIDAESPELRRDERLARLRRAAGLPGSYWDSWLCTSSRRISGCETGIAESRRIGEVLYPSKAVAVNSAGVRGKQINLPREVWRVFGQCFRQRLGLAASQEAVIARQKSAEGIVDGCRPARVLRHSCPKGGATDKPNRSPIEGPNGP